MSEYLGGCYITMGCVSEDHLNCQQENIPQQKIYLDDFRIGKYEVTQAQWAELIIEERRLGHGFGQGNDHPVYAVSWFDAVTFCNRLSQREGLRPAYYEDSDFTKVYDSLNEGSGRVYWDFSANGYRLPTESEWEYAARGGRLSQGYNYSGSDSIGEVAWYTKNSNSQSHPVGKKKSNELELYDMSGNVLEWCWDSYQYGYSVKDKSQRNPTGPEFDRRHIVRGGTWGGMAKGCTVTKTDYFYSNHRSNAIGFRIARSF